MPKKFFSLGLSFLMLLFLMASMLTGDTPRVYAESSSWINSGLNMRSNVSGNVGIGVTNPAFKLSVSSPNSKVFNIKPTGGGVDLYSTGNLNPHYANNFSLYQGAPGSGIQRMTINTSGNVGVGVSNPAYKLSVGDGYAKVLNVRPTSLGVDLYSTGSLNPVYTTNFSIYQGAPGAGYQRMTINSGGNIGIGTTNPMTKLTITGSGVTPTANYAQDSLLMLQSAGNSGISMHGGSSSFTFLSFGDPTGSKGRIDVTNNGSIMSFSTNSAIDGFQTRMYLASGGAYFYESLYPNESETESLGSSVRPWNALYLGDDQGATFGLHTNATLAYDEVTDDRMELTGTNASLYVEDKLGLGVSTYNFLDNGTGLKTLTIQSSILTLTASYSGAQGDHDDDFTLNETNAEVGDSVTIINTDASQNIIFNESAAVDLSGSTITLGPNDSIKLIYVTPEGGDALWIQTEYTNL